MNLNLESVQGRVQVVENFKQKLMNLELSINQKTHQQQIENNEAAKM
jgi:hypothetical protein